MFHFHKSMKPECRFVALLVTLDNALAISRLALLWYSHPVSLHAQTILISICLYDLNDWFHLDFSYMLALSISLLHGYSLYQYQHSSLQK